MKEIRLDINRDRCVGCEACVMACSFAQKSSFSSVNAHIWILKNESESLAIPMVCEQCENPPCRDVCPTEAIIEEPGGSGIIKIVSEKCIACKACMWVCPFKVITLDFEKGVAVKCELCGGDPECVKVCFLGALQYVSAEQLLKSKRRGLGEKRIEALKAR